MKECLKEQINLSLPWILEINKIACRLEIDLESAKTMSKEQWKNLVKKQVSIIATQYLENEIKEV